MKRLLVLILVILVPAVSALTLNDGVELYYSFDNGSVNATHVLDTAQGHHGIRVNGTVTEDGLENDSLGLHDGYVVVPAFDMGENFTICMEHRLKEFEHAFLSTYGEGFARSGGAFELFVNTYDQSDPQLGVILDDGSSFIEIDTTNHTHNASLDWHFICASYDGGNTSGAFRLFHNGELMTGIMNLSNGTYPGGYNRSRDLVIGAGNPDGDFASRDLDMDQLIIYKNRVLNGTEVGDLYQRWSAGEGYPFT